MSLEPLPTRKEETNTAGFDARRQIKIGLAMTAKRVPTVLNLQGLTRDEWEALGHDLCATMYEAERVEDRLGRGNGLDAFRQLEPEGDIDGWQFRRFDDRLGEPQIKKLKEAVARAVAACKDGLSGQLKTFTVFGNLDLQPGHRNAKGEDSRFAEFQKWCKAQHDVKAVYRGVTWVRSRLLKFPHLRPDLFEDLASAIESAKKEILSAVGGDAHIRKAFEELKTRSEGQLAVLVTEAKAHFERGQKRGQEEYWLLAVESLRDAERLATAPGVERSLLTHIQAVLAGLSTMTGRLNEALEIARRAAASAKAESDPSLLRLAQGNLAIALSDAQKYEEARALFLEVLRLYEDAAEPSEVVRTLTNLLHIDTSVRNWRGASSWATRLEEECTQLDQMIGVTEDSLNALGNIASFHFKAALELPEPSRTEELHRARVRFQNLLETSRLAKMRRTTIIAEATLASVLQHLAQYDDADDIFKRVIQTSDNEGLAKLAADCRYNQALMLQDAGRLDQATTAALDAAARYEIIGDQASKNDSELLLRDIRLKVR